MKILVISPHPEGFAPGQRLKYEQYFEYFKKNDIEVIVSPFISEKFLKIIYRKGYILHKIYFHNKKRCEVKNSAIRNMLLYKFYEFITSRGPIAT